VAQTWRKARSASDRRVAPALDGAALERIALRYVERYATTRAKLAAYLVRKVRERGWAPEPPPDIDALVQRLAALGYVDDASFAAAKAGGLARRGYGPRRVAASLRAAGVGDDDAGTARDQAREGAWEAALIFARRKRIGPFAAEIPDRPGREKAFASLLRAGHELAIARRILACAPGDVPQEDDD
jgi:regulatory protein